MRRECTSRVAQSDTRVDRTQPYELGSPCTISLPAEKTKPQHRCAAPVRARHEHGFGEEERFKRVVSEPVGQIDHGRIVEIAQKRQCDVKILGHHPLLPLPAGVKCRDGRSNPDRSESRCVGNIDCDEAAHRYTGFSACRRTMSIALDVARARTESLDPPRNRCSNTSVPPA